MNIFYWFVSSQLLIAVAYSLCLAAGLRNSYSEKLRLNYACLAVTIVMIILQPLVPIHKSFVTLPKGSAGFSASQIKGVDQISNSFVASNYNQEINSESVINFEKFNSFYFILILLAVALFRVGCDIVRLRKIKNDTFAIRKIGKLQILAHDQVQVPLTFWFPFNAVIIVPTKILGSPQDFRMAVLHELQHHRQGDPLWMYVIEFFRIFCWINPFAKAWVRSITEFQEFACDETLVGRHKVNSQQYARCLLQTAESSLESKFAPACAIGLLFRSERTQLRRRIKMLLSINPQRLSTHSKSWIKITVLTLCMGIVSYASKAIADSQVDKSISMAEAKELAKNLTGTEGLPVKINEEVLQELNAYVGSPLSRQKMRDGLERMRKDYQETVDSALTAYQLPKALEAIPLIESRYENLKESGSMKSAGLWQFIPPTARRMGIAVHEGKDERLNVQKLSDAAARLLKSNTLYYNDLGLSILAYNWGETKVNHLLGKTHSRDPWVLSRASENDRYLPKFIAGMLIIANPKIVD